MKSTRAGGPEQPYEAVLDDCANDIALLTQELSDLPSATDMEPHLTAARAALARGLFLTAAAIDVGRGAFPEAAGALARPAVECWIYCMDLVHTGPSAFLEVLQQGIRRESKLAERLHPELEFQAVVENKEGLEGLVAASRTAGYVPSSWKPPKELALRDRLRRAVDNAGVGAEWLMIYDGLYSALSVFDTHVPAALLTHLSDEEGTVTARPSPDSWIAPEALLANITLLMLAAARDLFPKLGELRPHWISRFIALAEVLQAHGRDVVDVAAHHDDPAVVQLAAKYSSILGPKAVDGDQT